MKNNKWKTKQVQCEGNEWVSVKKENGLVELTIESCTAYFTNKQVDELVRTIKMAKVYGE